MQLFNVNALDAIAYSESHNEIVTLRYSDVLRAELTLECDDMTETPETVEFWSDSWRVHLRK